MVIYGIEGIIKFDFARSRGNDCERFLLFHSGKFQGRAKEIWTQRILLLGNRLQRKTIS